MGSTIIGSSFSFIKGKLKTADQDLVLSNTAIVSGNESSGFLTINKSKFRTTYKIIDIN